VVADGWYEWQRAEDPRQRPRPLRFSLAGGDPFCFAGLWAASEDGGETVRSCAIVTCAANDLARPIHDRMPVVLPAPELWDAWLDPRLDGRDVSELLRPLASDELRVRPANPLVNSVANDGPGCLEPELTLL
jgi:putative SOS response-associated peptidase YedK